MSATVVGTVLSRSEWESRAEAHRARVAPQVTGVIERRARGEKHPVEDFLFHYYNLRPRHLEQWHPGVGVVLEDAESRASLPFQRRVARGMTLDVEAFLAKRGATVREAGRLLAASSAATPRFGCFGMHEWAMVYHLQPDQTRHSYLPLRFSPERVAEITEQVGVRCSHFDAFRFFTPDAQPLNEIPGHDGTPTRERQPELDQGGCLHTNMDLYKWAGKLLPLVDSELLLDCFELSRDIRELDMRASAYDLGEWGYEPVQVEAPAGRAQYVRMQREFADRGAALRQRLLTVLDAVKTGPAI